MKLGISPRVCSADNDVLGVLVSETCFHCLEDSPESVQRTFLMVFGWLWDLLGSAKTWIPVDTSDKNQLFKLFVSKTPLGSIFKAFWKFAIRFKQI